MRTATRAAGIVAGLTLSLGALSAPATAFADDATTTPSAPCAKEQSQVDKATAALERVTAVFEGKQAKVKKAKNEAATAAPGREKSEAKRALAEARKDKAEAAKVKKAQQQRVAKAQARLDACESEQPAVA